MYKYSTHTVDIPWGGRGTTTLTLYVCTSPEHRTRKEGDTHVAISSLKPQMCVSGCGGGGAIEFPLEFWRWRRLESTPPAVGGKTAKMDCFFSPNACVRAKSMPVPSRWFQGHFPHPLEVSREILFSMQYRGRGIFWPICTRKRFHVFPPVFIIPLPFIPPFVSSSPLLIPRSFRILKLFEFGIEHLWKPSCLLLTWACF